MDGHENLSLRQLTGVLRRRKWIIVQLALIGVTTAVVLSLRATNEYRASATLLVGAPQSLAVPGLPEADQTLSASTAAKLVRTRTVADRVKRALGSDLSPDELLSRVSTSADPRDGFVTVNGGGENGREAAQLANAFANQFVVARAASASKRVARAINAVRGELRAQPASSPEREALAAQLSQLRTLRALPIADAEVVDPARTPASPVGPHPLRDGLLGLALGLLFGIGLALALEALDPRIKDTDELQRLVPAPQLAVIPAAVFNRGLRRRMRREPRVLSAVRQHFEPFERLRTSLLVFNSEREIKSILVTSPQDEREGKTTVASNLAVSLAKIGLKVCVVDADLRRPRLARHFGLEDSATGLSDLIHGAPIKTAIRRFPVPESPAYANGNGNGASPQEPIEVSVISAGHKMANPADMLASKRMLEVLDELEARHDVVILDCPPILAESDAMSLVQRAGGVLLVIRLFHTPRKAAVRAARVIEHARGGMLGVVGTGVPARELREEGYGPWPVSHSQTSRVG